MAVNPTYPGVYVQELPSAVHPITGVATSTGAFAGYTARGIDERAQQIFSFADYERLFGELTSNSELSYAVQEFFANGSTQAHVVRVPWIGASGATVAFGEMTFTALSSGTWANGELLIDVDYNGLAQALAGPVTVAQGSPMVTGTAFTTTLEVGQHLVFASDPTQTPYQINDIANDTTLTLGSNYAQTSMTTTAVVIVDPLAFNLTLTNRVDGTVESFPNLSLSSGHNNYVTNVVNDPDYGSQLASVLVGSPTPTLPPAMAGIVGTAPDVTSVDILLGGTVVGTMALSHASATVIGTGTSFTDLAVGDYIVFASDPTFTPYQINAIASDTSMTLGVAYAGATAAATTAVIVEILLGGPAVAGTVALTHASATVTGTGTSFTTALTVGQSLVFASDPLTQYQISAIGSDTSLTLRTTYAGSTVASTTAAIVNVLGTVAVTNGSTTVTGTGTAFTAALTVGSHWCLARTRPIPFTRLPRSPVIPALL